MNYSQSVELKVISDFNEFQKLQYTWNELLTQSRNDRVFMTHEWFNSWWQAFGEGKSLFIILLKNDDEIIGIIPLMRCQSTFRGLPVRSIKCIENDDPPNGAGVRVVPTGVVDYDNTIGPCKVEFSVGGDAPSITITSQEVSFEGVGAAYLEGRLHAMSEAGREPIIRIGPANASHLSIGLFTLRGFIGSAERNFGLEIVAADSAFKLGGDDGDGFLNKLLPEDGWACRFELGMGWSKRDGFKLSGSLGIVVDLPIGMTIANTVTITLVPA